MCICRRNCMVGTLRPTSLRLFRNSLLNCRGKREAAFVKLPATGPAPMRRRFREEARQRQAAVRPVPRHRCCASAPPCARGEMPQMTSPASGEIGAGSAGPSCLVLVAAHCAASVTWLAQGLCRRSQASRHLHQMRDHVARAAAAPGLGSPQHDAASTRHRALSLRSDPGHRLADPTPSGPSPDSVRNARSR